MIRWRVNANGLEFFAPNRQWILIETEQEGKEFLAILNNVTKGYPNKETR